MQHSKVPLRGNLLIWRLLFLFLFLFFFVIVQKRCKLYYIKINFFIKNYLCIYIFILDSFDALILKNKKNIILIHFSTKKTLKNNYKYTMCIWKLYHKNTQERPEAKFLSRTKHSKYHLSRSSE